VLLFVPGIQSWICSNGTDDPDDLLMMKKGIGHLLIFDYFQDIEISSISRALFLSPKATHWTSSGVGYALSE
jgi:hypothetical protein